MNQTICMNKLRYQTTKVLKSGDQPKKPCLIGLALVASLCLFPLTLKAADTLKVGDKAGDFSLKGLDDVVVRLSELTQKGNVVLVVLRGWPGYQCPICDVQVHDFIASASGFAEAKTRLLFVYPGPAVDLKAHAQEFKDWKGKQWPAEFFYVLDPDYTMVNAYNLRWDAPRETAYPSTFVIDNKGIVRSVKISHSHSDRTKAADVLTQVRQLSVK